MSFSLLWKNDEKPVSIIDDTVFDDLRMRKFLEIVFNNYYDAEDFIDILKNIPSKETLKYRQEIFTDILNDNDDTYDKLYYELVDLISRYASFKTANEKIKKKVFFLFYSYHYYVFLERVSSVICKGESSCFKYLISKIKSELSSEKVIKRRDTISNLYNKLMEYLKFNVSYHEGSPYVSLEFKECGNLEDDLSEVARLLDVPLLKVPRLQNKREINPYFIYEISLLDKDLYEKISTFYDENNLSLFEDISYIAKELKFFLYMKTIFTSMTSKNIPYCKVKINENNETFINDLYDISLSTNNSITNIIPNDFIINDKENIQFILGVNSGGKTCYIRSVGENYILFMNCGYMFARKAEVYPVKYINTHFPNEENYRLGEGRLRDELSRLDIIRETFSAESISLLNETFSSTSEEKACTLTKTLLDDIGDTKAKVIFVTHQYKIFEEVHDERLGFYTPSVDENNNNERTHKIKKVDKKLLSYVGDILYKHGLTKQQLLARKSTKHE